MNIREGARRMRRAGQWMIFVPLTALLLLMFVVGILGILYSRTSNSLQSLSLIPRFLLLMIPGALLWLAGWIVEGFAKEGH